MGDNSLGCGGPNRYDKEKLTPEPGADSREGSDFFAQPDEPAPGDGEPDPARGELGEGFEVRPNDEPALITREAFPESNARPTSRTDPATEGADPENQPGANEEERGYRETFRAVKGFYPLYPGPIDDESKFRRDLVREATRREREAWTELYRDLHRRSSRQQAQLRAAREELRAEKERHAATKMELRDECERRDEIIRTTEALLRDEQEMHVEAREEIGRLKEVHKETEAAVRRVERQAEKAERELGEEQQAHDGAIRSVEMAVAAEREAWKRAFGSTDDTPLAVANEMMKRQARAVGRERGACAKQLCSAAEQYGSTGDRLIADALFKQAVKVLLSRVVDGEG